MVQGLLSNSNAERRQLTVLFCDLVGSTRLSQQLDAEDLRDLVLSYQGTAAEVIERYEGHIAQYLGDGLLVYFGHPVAHEDDAERAVRAGYDVLGALKRLNAVSTQRTPLSARVGIHTGTVVIGEMGAGGKLETLAMGETTNIAARIQGIAEPDTIVISQATLKLVPGLFITNPLGSQSLKGVEKSIHLFQIIQPSGVRSRLEAAEHLTPFVGRTQELALLKDRWQQASEGQGQAILVAAEPGLGKSRLLLSLREQIKDCAHTWLECRASPMTRNSSYRPVIEMLGHGLRFKDGDSNAIRLELLERALDSVDIDKPDAMPLIAPLLNLTLSETYEQSPYSPELKRRKIMEYLSTWVLALAKAQPLALVLEDLHWCDGSTLELMGRLLERIPTANVLLLMTARPEFQANWPRTLHLSDLNLQPLENPQVLAMLDSLTGDKALPQTVVQKIQERTNGVPPFVEEVTRQLLESGQLVERNGQLELAVAANHLSIPATLQDSLMARLDKQGEAKEVAQVCAVIGREIPYKLLTRIVEQEETRLQQNLRKLCDSGLFYQQGIPPESNYTYKHALIRDTAYNSLLKSTRAKLHGKIAITLAQYFKTRTQAEPAVLAEHFEKANLIEQSVKYYKAAGDAASSTAHREATVFFEKALVLLPSLPEGKPRDLLELALLTSLAVSLSFTRSHGNPEVRAALTRAQKLCSSEADPMVQATVLGHSWVTHMAAAEYEVATKYAEQCAALGKNIGQPVLVSNGISNAAFAYFMLGRLPEALACTAESMKFTDLQAGRVFARMVGNEPQAFALYMHGWSRWMAGYPDDALALTQQAAARAEATAVPLVSCVVATWGTMRLLRFRREWPALLVVCNSAATLCDRYGYEDGKLNTFASMGVALGLTGRIDEGLALLRQSIEIRQSAGVVHALTMDYADMSVIHLAAGRRDKARSELDKAFALMEKHDERMWEAELHRLDGELLLAEAAAGCKSDEAAEPCFRKALEVSRTQRSRSLELRAATSLARLWQKQGRKQEARDLLPPLYGGFTEGFDTPDLEDANVLLSQLQ